MLPKIAVVEDEEALSVLLRYNLEAEGYEVETVLRGDEAEIRLQDRVPDLPLLAWMLPGVSGIELCRRLRMRTETDPSAELNEALEAALFTHHPYGTPIIGWMHEIEDLGRADALAYYARFYTPENAILVVAGDVEAAEVEQLARKTYGAIAARGEARRHRVARLAQHEQADAESGQRGDERRDPDVEAGGEQGREDHGEDGDARGAVEDPGPGVHPPRGRRRPA